MVDATATVADPSGWSTGHALLLRPGQKATLIGKPDGGAWAHKGNAPANAGNNKRTSVVVSYAGLTCQPTTVNLS
jgi:hypothetical protein